MTSSDASFSLFTSLRYDPILRESMENSSPLLSFSAPSPFYMLVYHRDRMLEAAQHFEWHAVAQRLSDGPGLDRILNDEVTKYLGDTKATDGPLKVRVLFNSEASIKVELGPVPSIPISALYPTSFGSPSSATQKDTQPTWVLSLDTQPTTPFEHTSLKTTYRPHYTAARERALPDPSGAGGAMAEVIMYNPVNEITEGSLTSLFFYRGGKWVTPPVGVPANRTDGEYDAPGIDEGEMRDTFPGRWGHSLRSIRASGGQRGTTRRWALAQGFCMEEPISRDTIVVGEGVWVSNGVRGFGWGRVDGGGGAA